MSVLLVFVSVALVAGSAFALRETKAVDLKDNMLINTAFTGIIVIALSMWAVFTPVVITHITVLFGLLFGFLFFLAVSSNYFALISGPVSYTSFFSTGSMIIPTVIGSIIWKEPFTFFKVLGISILLLAFFLISTQHSANSVGKSGKKNIRWLLLCSITLLANGGLALTAKGQQMAEGGKNTASMMLLSFLFAFLFSLFSYAFLERKRVWKNYLKEGIQKIKKSFLPVLGVAICLGGGNLITTYLSSRMASTLLYPIVQGGSLLVITVCSALFYKERMNKKGKIGMLTGLLGIVIINIK